MSPKDEAYRCYLTTPLQDGFSELRQIIGRTLEEMDVQPVLIENFTDRSRSISEVLLHEIQRADFVIADLTNNNPNVAYELGYARALEMPLMVLVQKDAREVPFDVSSFLYTVYDPTRPDELRHKIRVWVHRIIERLDAERSER